MKSSAPLASLLVLLAACGAPAAPVAPAPPEPSTPPVASAPAGGSAAAPAPALPEDVEAAPLGASLTLLCPVSGKLAAGRHALAAAPGGRMVATVQGAPDARVLVLEGGKLFAELAWNGVKVRGYLLDEQPLSLGKPKTLGGVWTRTGAGVRVTGPGLGSVRATLEPKVANVELVGGSDAVDVPCEELALGPSPSIARAMAGKRTAFVGPKTKLELSETEKGTPTVRWTADARFGIPVEVLEEHAGRARIGFDMPGERLVGWVRSGALSPVPKLDRGAAARLAAEADKVQLTMLGAMSGSPGGQVGALSRSPTGNLPSRPVDLDGPGSVVAACDLRLLATMNGALVQIGTLAGGTKVRLGEPSHALQSVAVDGVTVVGGAKVPARDNLACENARQAPSAGKSQARMHIIEPSALVSRSSYDMDAARASTLPSSVTFRVDGAPTRQGSSVTVNALLENSADAPAHVTVFPAAAFGFFVRPATDRARAKPAPPGMPRMPPPVPPPPLVLELPAKTAVRLAVTVALDDYDWTPGAPRELEWSFDVWNEPRPRGRVAVP